MASGPIMAWQIDGENGETESDFIFLGSKINVDGDFSYKIKRHLLLWRITMTNLDSILKSRDITLLTKVCIVKLRFFQWSCTDVRFGLERRLSAEELMLLNCGVGEDSWESRVLQDQTSQSWRKSVLNIHWEDWWWSWSSNTLATWWEKLTHQKRPWCWERLKAGGEEGDRGWDGWIASPTQWTWFWANSRRQRTGKSGVLQSRAKR